tara:strand:+ start:9287 stop:10612 length:1326 start_codon:yes stop_codon:yes gene_type:complete
MDSDVINGLHSGRFPDLYEFLKENESRVIITFSQAHVSDKLPSRAHSEDKFWKDLDFISELSHNRFINFDNKSKITRPYIASARKVLEEIESNQLQTEEFLKVDSMINFMEETSQELGISEVGKLFKKLFELPSINQKDSSLKDEFQVALDQVMKMKNNPYYYKEKRNEAQEDIGLPDFAGQWNEKVIEKIGEHLKAKGKYKDFFELVNKSFSNKKTITWFEYFTTAYQMLNILGYKADEIKPKKNKGLNNHILDSMHAFYGAHSDYFVAMDKKLVAKSKAIYEAIGVKTILINPKDLKGVLQERCYQDSFSKVTSRAIENGAVDTLVEHGIKKSLFKINGHWLDYFTHIQIERDPNSEKIRFLFFKEIINFSNHIFNSEVKRLIESISTNLGLNLDIDQTIKVFRENEKNSRFVNYTTELIHIRLTLNGATFYMVIDSFQ